MKLENAVQNGSAEAQAGARPKPAPVSRRPVSASFCVLPGQDTSGLRRALEGVLLGTAVGDALGLPSENLSPRRIRRRWKGQWRMRFVLKYH